MLGTSLFGAIAVAREYGHDTVVPTFLMTPKRAPGDPRPADRGAVAGAVLALAGQALVITGVALALPSTEHGLLVSAGDLARLLAAATLAGAIGATLGAGLGCLLRNTGGAVTTAVLLLFVIPPLAVQLATDAASWIPRPCSP